VGDARIACAAGLLKGSQYSFPSITHWACVYGQTWKAL